MFIVKNILTSWKGDDQPATTNIANLKSNASEIRKAKLKKKTNTYNLQFF